MANLSEQIADYMTEKTIRLKIRPGERIMETRIADELGVSRSRKLLLMGKHALKKSAKPAYSFSSSLTARPILSSNNGFLIYAPAPSL